MLPTTTRVMIVDRDSRSVAHVAALFGALGYADTDNANSMSVALQRLHNCDMYNNAAFGLVYIDWDMDAPANGSTMLETIRRDYKVKQTPVIMCCEMRHVPYARYMTKEGILQGYILKPATLEALSVVLTPLVPPTLPSFNV